MAEEGGVSDGGMGLGDGSMRWPEDFQAVTPVGGVSGVFAALAQEPAVAAAAASRQRMVQWQVCVCVCVSVCLSVCVSVCLSVCACECVRVCVSVRASFASLSLSPAVCAVWCDAMQLVTSLFERGASEHAVSELVREMQGWVTAADQATASPGVVRFVVHLLLWLSRLVLRDHNSFDAFHNALNGVVRQRPYHSTTQARNMEGEPPGRVPASKRRDATVLSWPR